MTPATSVGSKGASTPNQRLQDLATKSTPEALRDLEQTWREKRRMKLAAMRAEEVGSNNPTAELDLARSSGRPPIATQPVKHGSRTPLSTILPLRRPQPAVVTSSSRASIVPLGDEKVQPVRSRPAGIKAVLEDARSSRKVEAAPTILGNSNAIEVKPSKAIVKRAMASADLHSSSMTAKRKMNRTQQPHNGHQTISADPSIIDFHLLPTGTRRISQEVTMTIYQDLSTSFDVTSSTTAVPLRSLVLEIADEAYEVGSGSQEMTVINRTSSTATAKPQRLKLSQSGKWSAKDRKRWEMVHGVVERVKRHTERTTWNLPSGCLHVMCNDPPDVVYHHHASLPVATKAVKPAGRTISAAVTLSPSRGFLQLSIRRRWPAEQEGVLNLGWTSKRAMRLPKGPSITQSIRVLLDDQNGKAESRHGGNDIKMKLRHGEAGEEWDRDEVKVLKIFLSLRHHWETALA